jgi:hypothetical protein
MEAMGEGVIVSGGAVGNQLLYFYDFAGWKP